MKEKNERKGGKKKKENTREKKREGDGFTGGGRGAWVLRRAGPRTNNAIST